MSETAISTYKHIGRIRSARLVGIDLAKFYLQLGQVSPSLLWYFLHLILACLRWSKSGSTWVRLPSERQLNSSKASLSWSMKRSINIWRIDVPTYNLAGLNLCQFTHPIKIWRIDVTPSLKPWTRSIMHDKCCKTRIKPIDSCSFFPFRGLGECTALLGLCPCMSSPKALHPNIEMLRWRVVEAIESY